MSALRDPAPAHQLLENALNALGAARARVEQLDVIADEVQRLTADPTLL